MTQHDILQCFKAAQLPKMKKYIPYSPCHKIYRVQAVGPSVSNYTFKITSFGTVCKFWVNFEKTKVFFLQ